MPTLRLLLLGSALLELLPELSRQADRPMEPMARRDAVGPGTPPAGGADDPQTASRPLSVPPSPVRRPRSGGRPHRDGRGPRHHRRGGAVGRDHRLPPDPRLPRQLASPSSPMAGSVRTGPSCAGRGGQGTRPPCSRRRSGGRCSGSSCAAVSSTKTKPRACSSGLTRGFTSTPGSGCPRTTAPSPFGWRGTAPGTRSD